MEQDERVLYQGIVNKMLSAMLAMKGSDLFITADYPPSVKLNDKLVKLNLSG